MTFAVDHVLLAVGDLDTAARGLEARHGLVALSGGRHPGWGTANRIVPLGSSYLELVAVVDAAEAAASLFGSWVARSQGTFGWAARVADIEEVAVRHGLEIVPGSRRAAGGRLLSWRTAGVEQAAAERPLPFFIEWGAGTPFPGALEGGVPATLSQLRLTGDRDRLADWLGGPIGGVTIEPGVPGIVAVVAGPRGAVEL